jgi:hypothetical protein
MDQTKASERTMFKIRFRRELIDAAERRIEHEKSMIKNYKAQIKVMTREWDEQRGREDRMARVDYRVAELVGAAA